MDAGRAASIPITRPHLPPIERFSELVADLFASRMLSNFAKYTGLLESRAAAVLDQAKQVRERDRPHHIWSKGRGAAIRALWPVQARPVPGTRLEA
jgi:hypothetical protein